MLQWILVLCFCIVRATDDDFCPESQISCITYSCGATQTCLELLLDEELNNEIESNPVQLVFLLGATVAVLGWFFEMAFTKIEFDLGQVYDPLELCDDEKSPASERGQKKWIHSDGVKESNDLANANLGLYLFKSFQREVCVLGCCSFVTWLVGFVLNDESYRQATENVHFCFFIALGLQLCMNRLFTVSVKRKIRQCELFTNDPDKLEAENPRLKTVLTNAEDLLKKNLMLLKADGNEYADPEHVKLGEYLSLSMVGAVQDLVHFQSSSWIISGALSAGSSFVAMFISDDRLYIILWACIGILLVHIGIIEIQIFKFLNPQPDPTTYSLAGTAGSQSMYNSLHQALTFYICFHAAYCFLNFVSMDLLIRDIAIFLPFAIVYPWMLGGSFHVVLALPPYFNEQDLAALKGIEEALELES